MLRYQVELQVAQEHADAIHPVLLLMALLQQGRFAQVERKQHAVVDTYELFLGLCVLG